MRLSCSLITFLRQLRAPSTPSNSGISLTPSLSPNPYVLNIIGNLDKSMASSQTYSGPDQSGESTIIYVVPSPLEKCFCPLSFQSQNLLSEQVYFNNSFQMNSFKTQMALMECTKNYFFIVQLPSNNSNPTQASELSFLPNLPIHKFQSMQNLWDSRYLIHLIDDHAKFVHPTDGVFAKFKQSENSVFAKFIQNQSSIIYLFVVFCIILAALRIYFASRSVRNLGQKYEISLGTSQKFKNDFRQSKIDLKKCIDQMKKFNHETTFQIVKQKPFNYKQIEDKKVYTVRSGTNFSTKEIKNQSDSKFTDRSNQYLKQSEKSVVDIQNKPFTSAFSSFLFSFLKFPLISVMVTLVLFSQNCTNYSNKITSIQTYSLGIEKLSSINLELLNLMSQNLWFFSLKTLQLKPNEQEAKMKRLRESFTKTITRVSTSDKSNIIAQLFLQNSRQDEVVSKILYRNLCTQFPIQFDCPFYMVPKINGLIQKYDQAIKNINILFHKIISSNRTESGLLDTITYQNRYVQSYQNLNQLMYMNKKIRKMSFDNLEETIGTKVFTSLTQKQPPTNNFSSDFYFVFILIALFTLEAVMFLFKFYCENKIVTEEFLKIGTCTMFQNEKNSFEGEGYATFTNIAQNQQWLQKDQ